MKLLIGAAAAAAVAVWVAKRPKGYRPTIEVTGLTDLQRDLFNLIIRHPTAHRPAQTGGGLTADEQELLADIERQILAMD